MTEQTPDTTTPDVGEGTTTPTPDPTPDVAPAKVYKAKAPEGNKGSGRFAVYDLTLERYVSEVSDSKPSSTDAKKLVAEGHDFKVIEV